MFEAGIVEAVDALSAEQKSIGDHSSDHAVFANVADDFFKLRMEQRFAAADGDDGSSHCREVVQTEFHFFERDGLGNLVVFVAIAAIEIAAAHGDDMDQDRVLGREQCLADHFEFAGASPQKAQFAPSFDLGSRRDELSAGGQEIHRCILSKLYMTVAGGFASGMSAVAKKGA